MRRRPLLALAATLAGCGARPPGESPSPTTGVGDQRSGTPLPADGTYGYTHLCPDGNRHAAGQGDLPSTSPLDVSLPGDPAWVVATPDGAGTVWGVRLADGRDRIYRLAGRSVSELRSARTAGGGPPLLSVADDRPRLHGGRRHTHPVPVPGDTSGAAVVRRDGRLALPGGSLDVAALPDARIVTDGRKLYLLAEPTDSYGHGVLGDGIEATAVAVVDPATRAVRRLRPPTGVVEGLAPIVADVDGDGSREVLVTASDADAGARLVALDPDGRVAATGPPVGQGYRWRHQIAVAPFGPDGTTEVAAVRTPHLGGVAEFYRVDGDRLSLVAERAGGYASHRIGSRNLDMAAAGDFDGDGRPELLVPGEDGRRLVALRRMGNGVTEAWRKPLGGRLLTNLAAATGEGGLALGVGRGGTLRLWPGAGSE